MTVLVTGGSGFIGTNLVRILRSYGEQVISADVVGPRDPDQLDVHRDVDLLDYEAVAGLIRDTAPGVVYHLAARTDLDGNSAADYRANSTGTGNLLAALAGWGFDGRLVHVSSMLVCRNGYVPSSDTDFCPSTPYGESKVVAERLVRATEAFGWVICRPTSIWGPWFGPPYRDFFDTVRAGRYVHPGRRDVVKAFGFVDNVARQLVAAADAPIGSTHYISDAEQYTVRAFADAIARQYGKRIPTVPVALLRVVAGLGDLAKRSGVWSAPPMTSFRLRNMMTESRFDTTEIEALVTARFGPARTGLVDGVRLTTDWLEHAASTTGRSTS